MRDSFSRALTSRKGQQLSWLLLVMIALLMLIGATAFAYFEIRSLGEERSRSKIEVRLARMTADHLKTELEAEVARVEGLRKHVERLESESRATISAIRTEMYERISDIQDILIADMSDSDKRRLADKIIARGSSQKTNAEQKLLAELEKPGALRDKYAEALQALSAERHAEAERLFSDAIKLAGNDSKLYFGRGQARYFLARQGTMSERSGSNDELLNAALSDFRFVINSDVPNQLKSSAHAFAGFCSFFLSKPNYGAAEDSFKSALVREPRNAQYANEIAKARLLLSVPDKSKIRDSIKLFEEAAKLARSTLERANITENIGVAYLHLEEYDKALDHAAGLRNLFADSAWNSLVIWIAASKINGRTNSFTEDEVRKFSRQAESEWKSKISLWTPAQKSRNYESLRRMLPSNAQSFLSDLRPAN